MAVKVRVEHCWEGHENFSFRISNGWYAFVFHLSGEQWNRSLASRALDKIESFGLKRSAVRFVHH